MMISKMKSINIYLIISIKLDYERSFKSLSTTLHNISVRGGCGPISYLLAWIYKSVCNRGADGVEE